MVKSKQIIQEKINEVIKVQETVQHIEINLPSSQAEIMEEAKQIKATYADASKVKEIIIEMGGQRHQDHKGRNKN